MRDFKGTQILCKNAHYLIKLIFPNWGQWANFEQTLNT